MPDTQEGAVVRTNVVVHAARHLVFVRERGGTAVKRERAAAVGRDDCRAESGASDRSGCLATGCLVVNGEGLVVERHRSAQPNVVDVGDGCVLETRRRDLRVVELNGQNHAKSLGIEEEERLVLLDRTTERTSPLI